MIIYVRMICRVPAMKVEKGNIFLLFFFFVFCLFFVFVFFVFVFVFVFLAGFH